MLRSLTAATLVAGALTTGSALAAGPPAAAAAGAPSGQVTYGTATFDATTGTFVGGGGTIEPAYDAATGGRIFLQTPTHAVANPASGIDATTGLPADVAPLYIVVYPAGSGIDPATLNCAHLPGDNCPDHGPAVAGAAMQIVNAVYGGGVLGHDHLAGIASTGGDFNVLWEPVLVLFTSVSASKTHVTTVAAVDADVSSGKALEVPLPSLDFKCTPVSAAAYARGTPVTPVG